MNCPICDVTMAPALIHHWDGPVFLCSCGQHEDIVTQQQLHDWVQQSMALQFVARQPIKMFEGEGEGCVDDTLAAVAAGLKTLFGR